MDELTCFKTYDIRGEVDVNLTLTLRVASEGRTPSGCIPGAW
jgi:hypothetical protein